MAQRDEQNAVILHRVEVIETTVKNLHIFDKEDLEAFTAMVSVYRGIVAFRTVGKWLLVLAAGASTLVILYGQLKGLISK